MNDEKRKAVFKVVGLRTLVNQFEDQNSYFLQEDQYARYIVDKIKQTILEVENLIGEVDGFNG